MLNNEVKGTDPTLSKKWNSLRRGQKTAIIALFNARFRKSRQVICRGVKDRGFFEYEATFLKSKMVELGFALETDFPGLQMELFSNPKPEAQ